MGRTIPTFTMAIEMEKRRWKPFRNALYDKSDRKDFDKMFDIPRSYTSACSASVQIIRLHPILMSILLHHHKQLTECIEQVKQIEARVKEGSYFLKPQQPQRKEERQEEVGEEYATNTGTLDSYLSKIKLLKVNNNNNYDYNNTTKSYQNSLF